MYSVITPIYKNASFIPMLIAEFEGIAASVKERYGMETEFVFVVDDSPDDSYERLRNALPTSGLNSQLILHSRNFGSFAAVRSGLSVARGEYFAVIAADLQEPPEVLLQFLEALHEREVDVVIGRRSGRNDPVLSQLMSNTFWSFYRRLVVRDLPPGGVDIFGCNRQFCTELLQLEESNSSLVALIFWLGFNRAEIRYHRRKRKFGKSGWSIKKRVNYLLDSIFSFTDLPIRMLSFLGALGVGAAFGLTLLVAAARYLGRIEVPGYAATVITVMFFGGLNTFGLGIVGSYAWRTYENTKARPLSVLRRHHTYEPTLQAAAPASSVDAERAKVSNGLFRSVKVGEGS